MRYRSRLWVRALEDRTVPALFSVTTTADSGAGSLRQAITDANGNFGSDSIVFDAAKFATPQIITLSSTLTITDSVMITGTSAANVTISGNSSVRVLSINGPGYIKVSLE